jgi:hypothetical protein
VAGAAERTTEVGFTTEVVESDGFTTEVVESDGFTTEVVESVGFPEGFPVERFPEGFPTTVAELDEINEGDKTTSIARAILDIAEFSPGTAVGFAEGESNPMATEETSSPSNWTYSLTVDN